MKTLLKGLTCARRHLLAAEALSVAALTLLLALPARRTQAADLADAPPAIRTLAVMLQGKNSAEVRAVIIAQFGPPQRDVGSGLRIEEWDTANGTLIFHPGGGPSFFDSKTGKSFRLLQTRNPAHSNLLQSYEMFTLPDADYNGNKFWLGNLRLGNDMTYTFKDSGQNMSHRKAQADNFFLRHPSGNYEFRYVAPVTRETLLETLAEDVTVARLVFTSADGKSRTTFAITSSEALRRLTFTSDKPLCFAMDASWQNFWK